MTDNELIAEFMGIGVTKSHGLLWIVEESGDMPDYVNGGTYNPDTDWNDIMPVVERIFAVAPADVKEINNEGLDIFELGLTAKINEIYQAVIEFIKWYNENKTK